jgi:hypothetical protein
MCKISKEEKNKNTILLFYLKLKNNEIVSINPSKSGTSINKDRETYYPEISRDEEKEIKDLLVDDKLLIFKIGGKMYSPCHIISQKGEEFIKNGGYCRQYKLKNIFNKHISEIIAISAFIISLIALFK